MLKKILFALFVVLAIMAATMGYFYLKQLKKPKILATQLIPSDCAIVLESSDFLNVFRKLNETNLMWEELQQIEALKQLNRNYFLLDSIVGNDQRIRSIFDQNKVYIAAYPAEEDQYKFLFVMNLPDVNYTRDVEEYLQKKATKINKSGPTAVEELKQAWFAVTEKPGYFYLKDGILAVSADSSLLLRALHEMDKQVLATDQKFTSLEESAGNDAEFRFFYNHRFNEKYSQYLSQSVREEGLFKISNASGWTELDLHFTPNELMMNGFTNCDSSLFLKAIARQKPSEVEFTEVAPYNTKAFAFVGIGDREKFKYDLLFHDDDLNIREKYNRKLDIDLISSVQQLADNELVVLQTREQDTSAIYALAKIQDHDEAINFLRQSADSVFYLQENDSVYAYSDATVFKTFSFGLFTFEPKYCCVIKNYLLFAASIKEARKYITLLGQNQVLSRNEKFMNFSDSKLGKETNFYLYTSFSGSLPFLSNYFSKDINELFEKHGRMFEKFSALAYQLTVSRGKLLNQAYLLYSPSENIQTNSVWETQLDTCGLLPPQIVVNHKTGGKEIVVQDAKNKLYLISNTGKIVWTKVLEGQIKGKIVQVDYFKNGKLQLLFNTSSAIHLIDRNGNYVQTYPVQLKAAASAGMSVFDYEANKDYRILIPCKNGTVLNYNIQGKEVEGFVSPKFNSPIQLPVTWLRIANKDYLIMADSLGSITGVGRKGEARLSFTHKAPVNAHSWYFEPGKDLMKSHIHFVDSAEKRIVKISLNGAWQEAFIDTKMKVRESHFATVNEDQLTDYILWSETGWAVCDDRGKEMLKYESEKELLPFIKVIKDASDVYFLIAEREVEKCKLINEKGKEIGGIQFNSGTMPVLDNINKDAGLYLISTSSSKVICYMFSLSHE